MHDASEKSEAGKAKHTFTLLTVSSKQEAMNIMSQAIGCNKIGRLYFVKKCIFLGNDNIVHFDETPSR